MVSISGSQCSKELMLEQHLCIILPIILGDTFTLRGRTHKEGLDLECWATAKNKLLMSPVEQKPAMSASYFRTLDAPPLGAGNKPLSLRMISGRFNNSKKKEMTLTSWCLFIVILLIILLKLLKFICIHQMMVGWDTPHVSPLGLKKKTDQECGHSLSHRWLRNQWNGT